AVAVSLNKKDVYPPWGQRMDATGPLLLTLGYRTVFTIFGGWLVARLAPRNPMGHAWALGGIGVVLGTIGLVAARDFGPLWYPLAIVLLAVPSTWLGAFFFARKAR